MAQAHLTYHKASHRPMTTAHLAQTMSLLEMNNYELLEKIQGELSNNPALELNEDPKCPACGKRLINRLCPSCSKPTSSDVFEPLVFVSARNDSASSTYYQKSGEDIDSFVDISPQTEDLASYVLAQIRTELKFEERIIAAHILTSLDDDGLLSIPIVEIAMFHHVPLSAVEHVRTLILNCEPLGVGASSAKEALLIQARHLFNQGKFSDNALKAIEDGYSELSHKNFRSLSKLIGVTLKEAENIANYISDNLNPFPARAHWGEHHADTSNLPTRYQSPDVVITRMGDSDKPQLMVEVLWPIRGTLRINPDFRKAISDAPPEKSDAWNDDYQKAHLLIKCLGQRNHTLVQLMQKLAEQQREYILKGDAHLQPLTRASLAEELDVHESTISRAVSSKSVQLPSGKIVPISQFFDRSLHIRTEIKQIIEQESKPLSDTKITKILSKKGYNIARRTVAKYRSMEGILPAHLRLKKK